MKRLLPLMAGCIAAAWCGSAFAHAAPVSYEPDAYSVSASMPQRVRMRFSERIEPGASTLQIFDAAGDAVPSEEVTVYQGDPRAFAAVLHGTGTGTFTVAWQVVSADDGHFTKGAFTFSVGTAAVSPDDAPGEFQMVHRSARIEGLAIALELLGAGMLEGSLLLALFLFAPLRRSKKALAWEAFVPRWTLCVCLSLALLLIGSGAYIALQTQLLAQNGSLHALRSVLGTATGSFAAYRAVCGIVFLALFLVLRKRLFSAGALRISSIVILWLPLLAFAYLRARVSHAAASQAVPELSIFINFLHVLSKDGWIGASVVYCCFLLPFLETSKDRTLLLHASVRYALMTSLLLIVGGVSGSYIVWLHLKDFSNVGDTLWGARFTVLTIFAALFLGLRLYRQLLMDARETEYAKLPLSIRRFAAAEAFAGLCVLFTSSLLVITTPPLPLQPLLHQSVQSAGGTITLEEHRYDARSMLLTFSDASGNALSIDKPIVTITNAERGIGPIEERLEQRFEGGFVFPIADLSLPGSWEIQVSGTRASGYDAAGSFSVRYPQDFGLHKTYDGSGPFTPLAASSLLIACLLCMLGAWLYVHAKKREVSVAALPMHKEESHVRWTLWVLAAVPTAVCIAVVSLLASSFKLDCGRQGFFWHENVPMEKGRSIGSESRVGCMVGMGKGMFHFADAREFTWFMRPGEAIAEMTSSPETPQVAVPTKLLFTIKDEDGNPVHDLVAEHDRLLHIIVISDDKSVFLHLHTDTTAQQLAASRFPVQVSFPKPGLYLVSAGFTRRGKSFSQNFYVRVPGDATPQSPAADTSFTKTFGAYSVSLAVPRTLTATKTYRLRYSISKDGKDVTDLQPYLAAAMHLGVVREDLRRFQHTHGLVSAPLLDRLLDPSLANNVHANLPSFFGPDIDALVSFPTPGVYTLFGEIRRGKDVIVTKFTVNVQ
jgi:methionine-rich copper-binding protein CopC